MSQKESEWEGELKELLTDYKDAEISWGYGDPEDVTNAIGDIKDFIRQTIDTAVSNREKEIAKEIEKMALDKVGDSEATRKQILSILKHQ